MWFDRSVTDDERIDAAIALAAELLVASHADESRRERRDRLRLGRLISDPVGREFTLALTDQVLRIDDRQRAADRFASLVDELGVPPTLGPLDKAMVKAGSRLAPRLARLVMPLVERRIMAETRGVVLPADDPAFAEYVARRRADGVRLNVNVLGEAILSDAEAQRRMRQVSDRIARPDVDYVSVKISAIVANLDVYAFEHSVERIVESLQTLYRRGRDATPRTFINLDMEEYSDLDLTVAAFTEVLATDEFADLDAGIVLQAYLPDSHAVLERLGTFAVERRQRGGRGHIKIRVVKGANLHMERVEAELHGWNQAPYPSKHDVDASFKAMLESALRPEWAEAVRLGIASHNLFELAWAWLLVGELDSRDRIDVEMLEGMAPAQARQVHARTHDLLLYAPVVERSDFDASVAYLSRRLDENTSPENFLRALFDLHPGDATWNEQALRFRSSVVDRVKIDTSSRRASLPATLGVGFVNEPEADFTRTAVRDVVRSAVRAPNRDEPPRVESTDDVDQMLAVAHAGAVRWSTTPVEERRRILHRVAALMSEERAAAIAVMADEAGKTVHEADPEISEAVDFARYYSDRAADLDALLAADGVGMGGRGVVAVIAPWNFPYAIPAGGVFAALAGGNAVILKPAPETPRTAWWLARQLWRAGVPDDVFQYAAIDDGPVGTHLVTHPDVDTVVLTGAYDTAARFFEWKPDRRLLAETSGKNSMVITAAADLDGAIADLVRSAFGHAGQKCSAASLAIVDAPVYDDPEFSDRLRAAVESLVVGPGADPATMMGPLIRPPDGPLARALTTLEPGERWLVEPRQLDDGGTTWTPGVRLGVGDRSWFHQTECFGPVLGVMRADDLEHAIELQNGVAYGLTGGIQSLDPNEVDRWLDQVQVGNAYVNRHITGAIVQRQPFGGWKRSSVGPGAKAGGPGYVPLFCRFDGPRGATLDDARRSYRHWWTTWFADVHDATGLECERNALRYRPLTRVLLRHDTSTAADSLELARSAAAVCGVALELSSVDEESDEQLIARLHASRAERIDRMRLLTGASDGLLLACHQADIAVDGEPLSHHGRIELGHWVREQAISETAHRHGRPLLSTGVDRLRAR
jgi:RHH-type proline utilization regulon transcriptional repressor/proline dehydrogenase/delta 1-pyrroline-5-carboxylate dehydrogenase